MSIPTKYRKGTDTPFISFSFTDFATGAGILELNGMATKTSSYASVFEYHLVTQATETGNENPTLTKDHDRRTSFTAASEETTFETSKLSQPLTLNGKGWVNFTASHTSTATGPNAIVMRLKRNDTQIAEASGAFLEGANQQKNQNFYFNLVNQRFATGDQIKLTIFNHESSSPSNTYIMHDPLNRDVTSYTPLGGIGTLPAVDSADYPTQLKLYLPVKLT